jgi:hypothetical protein
MNFLELPLSTSEITEAIASGVLISLPAAALAMNLTQWTLRHRLKREGIAGYRLRRRIYLPQAITQAAALRT